MTGVSIRALSPKGGHINHAVPARQYTALCGYAPSSPKASHLRPRSGWRCMEPDAEVTCKKCLARLPDVENLLMEGDDGGKSK